MSIFCGSMQRVSSSTFSTKGPGGSQQWDQEQQRYFWWLVDDQNIGAGLARSYGGRLGSFSQGNGDLEAPRCMVMALLNLEPFGYEVMTLCAVCEMACFLYPLFLPWLGGSWEVTSM